MKRSSLHPFLPPSSIFQLPCRTDHHSAALCSSHAPLREPTHHYRKEVARSLADKPPASRGVVADASAVEAERNDEKEDQDCEASHGAEGSLVALVFDPRLAAVRDAECDDVLEPVNQKQQLSSDKRVAIYRVYHTNISHSSEPHGDQPCSYEDDCPCKLPAGPESKHQAPDGHGDGGDQQEDQARF